MRTSSAALIIALLLSGCAGADFNAGTGASQTTKDTVWIKHRIPSK